jgi:hypothetical protein
MASLALLVCFIFLITLAIGPICYIICSFKWMPTWIVVLFSLMTSIVGILWIILPIGNILRLMGCIPLYCAYVSVKRRKIF